jgi:hypothetical protein
VHTFGLMIIGSFVVFALWFTYFMTKRDVVRVIRGMSEDARQGNRVKLNDLED